MGNERKWMEKLADENVMRDWFVQGI